VKTGLKASDKLKKMFEEQQNIELQRMQTAKMSAESFQRSKLAKTMLEVSIKLQQYCDSCL